MDIRLSDDIRAALNVGTTLTTRFWLALAMLLYGTGFLLKEGSWLLSPSFQTINGYSTLTRRKPTHRASYRVEYQTFEFECIPIAHRGHHLKFVQSVHSLLRIILD